MAPKGLGEEKGRGGAECGSGGGLAPLGRCAVVGSSGLLRVSPQGAAIDSYDTVVRLNAAPTLGFEARFVL